jgi:preprotein translocase subunit SecG
MSGSEFLIGLLLTVHVLVCVLMVLVIMMQRSKQEGLGAAFGSSVTDSVFGAQTSRVLVKTTVWLTGLFFVLTIALAHLYANRKDSSSIQEELLKPKSAGAAASEPAAAATIPQTTVPSTPAPAPASAPAAKP